MRVSDSLENSLSRFGEKVRNQTPSLLRSYQAVTDSGATCYVDQAGVARRIRPWCDAVEIAAMFDLVPDGMARNEWVAALQNFQDPKTGLVPEHIPGDASLNPPPAMEVRYADRYNTMIVNYALECLGSHLSHPVANAEALDAALLVETLDSLHWRDAAWGAGHWVDCYASSLYPNRKYFGLGLQIEVLFSWLDRNCDGETGLWGKWRPADRWLQPVNGFYRLTRGTYAQFGIPLPHAVRALDSILAHCTDQEFFSPGKGDACNVLDVVHPIWLCAKQGIHRREDATHWIRVRVPGILDQWVDGRGMAFDPACADMNGQPGLQGTEMWLSIIYLMADYLGLSSYLGYRPRGVHRPEVPLIITG